MHVEMSLDGRLDWIEKSNFLYYRVLTGWDIDAMLTDADTIVNANFEKGNENLDNYNDQKLVVLDERGKIREETWKIIVSQRWWNNKPVAIVNQETPKKYLEKLKNIEIEYIKIEEKNINLREILKLLRKEFNIHKLRIDSGGLINGQLLRNNLVDMISVVITPQLTGGRSIDKMFVAGDLKDFRDVVKLKLYDVRSLENDIIWLMYEVQK
jgi:2,5-diamino-6-(ribosylamino)-4(3H)-pyrimidinone 5'-phosphate reductase